MAHGIGTAKLVELKGLWWYLHIPVTKAVECFRKENVRHVVGIDRGLRFLTVSYDEQGKPNLFPGEKLRPNGTSFSKSDSSSNPKAQNLQSADSKPFPDERTVGCLM